MDKVKSESFTFANGKEMLDFIQKPNDIYNPETGEYIFLYNNRGSIASYHLTKAIAAELNRKSQETGEYWSGMLGISGLIYDDPTPEDSEDVISNLEYCEMKYYQSWIRTADYSKVFSEV